MRRTVGIASGAATAIVLAVLAGGAASSDIYITGKVVGRVAGSASSKVEIAWNYKCLGGKLGDATYEWTLKLVRTQPLPEQTTTLGTGTSQRGTKTIQLAPGQYLPKSDPFFCETERGAGSDKPEIGGPFTVPDYCSWKVLTAKGPVELEQGQAVKLARPGATVSPGNTLATPAGGSVTMSSLAGEGKAALAAGTKLQLDGRHCAAKGGWRFALTKGAVTVSVPPSAGKAVFETATSAATASGGKGSGWRMELAGKTTKVRALAGKVLVRKKSGAPVTLKAGQSATV